MLGDGSKIIEDKKRDKLKPWLQQAKNMNTHSKKIIEEIARVKVLLVDEKKTVVNRQSLITKEQLEKFEELMKPKARYIDNQFTQKLLQDKVKSHYQSGEESMKTLESKNTMIKDESKAEKPITVTSNLDKFSPISDRAAAILDSPYQLKMRKKLGIGSEETSVK